jgi:hypothetical protein
MIRPRHVYYDSKRNLKKQKTYEVFSIHLSRENTNGDKATCTANAIEECTCIAFWHCVAPMLSGSDQLSATHNNLTYRRVDHRERDHDATMTRVLHHHSMYDTVENDERRCRQKFGQEMERAWGR